MTWFWKYHPTAAHITKDWTHRQCRIRALSLSRSASCKMRCPGWEGCSWLQLQNASAQKAWPCFPCLQFSSIAPLCRLLFLKESSWGHWRWRGPFHFQRTEGSNWSASRGTSNTHHFGSLQTQRHCWSRTTQTRLAHCDCQGRLFRPLKRGRLGILGLLIHVSNVSNTFRWEWICCQAWPPCLPTVQ